MGWKFWKKNKKDKSRENTASEDLESNGNECQAVHPAVQMFCVKQLKTLEGIFLFMDPEMKSKATICEKCGACCAFFRVSFPSNELDDVEGGDVPACMTEPLNETTAFMKGSDAIHPRCIALSGVIGTHVHCLIYPNRPSACRNFFRSWENDTGNELCDKSRSIYALQPFSQY